MDNQLWVEPVGEIIVVRVRGVPNEALLRECQERVLLLLRETGCHRILYDALELVAPPVQVALFQEKLDQSTMEAKKLRRAIVVPNTKLAYLARLAFGEGDYRVFYNDIATAIKWLTEENE